MADDRLWLCCTECRDCALLARWGVSGSSRVDEDPVAEFIDVHAVAHLADQRSLEGHPFVLATDSEVVLGEQVRLR